ncbi:MAG: short chain dehydrogenase [Acidobacteria bacterium OLB17]|nr:MAG: short chain dehydrogenase [Acidobacteria bacterium OLB17]MCZ2389894.1 SDR family oxidoreductase [Acidobacteriota bacterium]
MGTDLQGKVAVITGGTKGIGLGIAEALVRAGAKVFVCGRSKTDVRAAVAGLSEFGDAAGETCDVRSEDQVRQMLEEAVRVFGGVDILVNSAGVGFNGTTVEETSGDVFRQTLETNLFGTFYACHYAIPLLKQRGGGYIINISSLMGQYAHAKAAAYNASKFGVNGFTEALMQEVRSDNIKVTGICPGSVNTYFGGDTPSEEKAWQLQPEDLGAVVLDLFAMDARALPSRIELRPSKPPAK